VAPRAGWETYMKFILDLVRADSTENHPQQYFLETRTNYTHLIIISISERLSRFDVKIYEVCHQERLVIDGDVASH
jgi:hypothetical protein